jgi:5-methylcytosine-specific restriction protein A
MADRSRSVAWLRDELILVLDLYMKGGGATTGAERDEVSALLRAIPVEVHLADNPSFRSRAAVARKLGKFAAIDPNSGNSGLPHLARGDQQVWEEFAHDPARLQAAAAAIRANLDSITPAEAEADEEDIADAPEGTILTRTHRVRERNAKLVARRKAKAKEQNGRVTCEGCSFDFEKVYGDRGTDFIECHHTVPVSSLVSGSHTRLKDLALVCSNCHRMIHRRAPWLTMDGLRALVDEHRTSTP